MKTETVKGTMKTAFQKALPYDVPYSGPVTLYETFAEIEAANDLPNNDEVLAYRNSQRTNTARQKYMAEALEVQAKLFTEKNGDKVSNPFVKPTLETDEGLRIKNIVDSLKAAGKSEAEALIIAKAALGISE